MTLRKRYSCLYLSEFGSVWSETFDSLREYRHWILANPDTEWAVVVLSSSAKIVHTYHSPALAKKLRKPQPPGDVETFV